MVDIETLTLNDYVYFKDKKHNENIIIKINNIETTSDNRSYITIDITSEHTIPVFNEDLEGIPVTKEFLLDNGFEEDTRFSRIIKIYSKKLWFNDKVVTLIFKNKDDKWILKIISVISELNDRVIVIDANYIHNIQHAFKLAKIPFDLNLDMYD